MDVALNWNSLSIYSIYNSHRFQDQLMDEILQKIPHWTSLRLALHELLENLKELLRKLRNQEKHQGKRIQSLEINGKLTNFIIYSLYAPRNSQETFDNLWKLEIPGNSKTIPTVPNNSFKPLKSESNLVRITWTKLWENPGNLFKSTGKV